MTERVYTKTRDAPQVETADRVGGSLAAAAGATGDSSAPEVN